MKIYDMDKIYTLYKEGKISKASYYRGKKRGWIYYEYHKPRDNGAKYTQTEMEEIYRYLFKVALNFYNIHKKQKYFHDRFIVEDMTHDAFLHIIQRKISLKNLKRKTKYLFKDLYLKRPIWAQYLDVPVSKSHKGSESKEITKEFIEK
jgi:hypothetical protein